MIDMFWIMNNHLTILKAHKFFFGHECSHITLKLHCLQIFNFCFFFVAMKIRTWPGMDESDIKETAILDDNISDGEESLLSANGHIPAAKTGAACDTTLIKPEVSMS